MAKKKAKHRAAAAPPKALPAGTVPNLFYRAMSTEALRRHERFVALPPVDSIAIDGPDSHRYVRQDSQLWDALHQGVLTTSKFKYALGLDEHKAAGQLGIPRHTVGGRGLRTAYVHLLQPPVELRSQPLPADAAAHNAAARQRQHAAKRQLAATPSMHATANAAPDATTAASAAGSSATTSAGTAPAVAALAEGVAALSVSSSRDAPATAEQRRALSQSVSSQGLTALRLAWGTVQEASALLALMHALPAGSWLEECGLWRPSDDALRRLGADPAALPPLGASPDGLAAHVVPVTVGHVLSAAAQAGLLDGRAYGYGTLATPSLAGDYLGDQEGWRLLAAIVQRHALTAHTVQQRTAGGSAAGSPSASSSASTSAAVAAKAAAAAAAAASRPSSRKGGRKAAAAAARATAASGAAATVAAAAVAEAAAAAPEAPPLEAAPAAQDDRPNAALETTAALPASGAASASAPEGDIAWHGGGGCSLDAAAAAVGDLLQLLLQRPSAAGTSSGAAASDCEPSSKDYYEALRLLEQRCDEHTAALSTSAAAGAADDNAACSQQAQHFDRRRVIVHLTVREVVEVKSHCPFAQNQHGVGAITGSGRFVLSDRGPLSQLLPQWVPQVQLHMLATGCRSALLVSRSATRGVRVFRMQRDDDYLATGLQYVGRLYRENVLPGTEPAEDMHWSDAHGYTRFLVRTSQLASSAQLVAAIEDNVVHEAADDNAFW